MPHLTYILFLFALGACIGSFLNVVVWRLPRGESLMTPPSHCPKCRHRLAWRDNLPVIGWILLRGRCRYCKVGISPRYPIIEAITGLLFVFYYIMFFILHIGPCAHISSGLGDKREYLMETLAQHWPIYGLYLFLLCGLLAASLIDAEQFIIPIEIPWLTAFIAIVVHAIIDQPRLPGTLNASPPAAALAAGAAVGLLISIGLWLAKIMPVSFPQGEPLLEVDREAVARELEQARREGKPVPALPPEHTKRQIRAEIQKEMLFLLPPMLLGAAWLLMTLHIDPIQRMWASATTHHWFTGLLGSILGALIGGFVVWLTRIFGTLGFGRVAMGLGDVHLMFGVGAVIGAGAATVAFFLAPFFGILIAIYMLLTGTRRELPYGPYLSMATAFVMLFYCPIADYLRPGLLGLAQMLHITTGG